MYEMTITLGEVEHICKLMKIDIDDHAQYVKQIDAMIDYFNILDSAGVDSEDIVMPELPLLNLRDDVHMPFNDKLIERLKHYKGTNIRAPKMSS